MTRKIEDFFSGLQNTITSAGLRKKEILEVIQEVTSIPLSSTQIEIKNKTLILKVKPLFREVILQKQEVILERITEKTGILFSIGW